ncbi:hypothetical protein V6N13_083313 [Hibiscus sabdariffa]
MHFGGFFATYPTLSYIGGKVMECDLDPDMLCYYTLCDMVKEAGYRAVKHFSYCEPGLQFNEGLRVCYDGSSVIAMINHLRNLGSLHIYVEHTVDIAEDLTLVSSIKDVTRDVTTEVWTTNEQESVGHVSNETDATLCRPPSEDEEIRDIWVKAKHKKKNLVLDELQVEDEVTVKIHRGQRKKKVNGVVGKNIGKSDEFGDETDYVDSSDLGSYDSDSEGKLVCKKSHHVYFDPTNPIPRFQLGTVFHGPKEFKEALAKYAIIKRFDIVYKRNESKRTRAWCKQAGCPFRIYVGLDKADGLYKIKNFKETHECSITFKNKRANYKYVGKHFLSKLRVLPKLKLDEMQKLVKEELKVDLNIGTCSRTRKWAMEEINGRVLYEFTRLFDYTYALRKEDPIANIELMVERPTPYEIPKFRRLYGLKEEICELLPRVENRVCARHLYANWKKDNSGGDLKQEFWAACKSTTEADFEQHISKIEQLKATAKESLLKTDPKQWSKSYFSTRSDCDATDNNFAEAFNFAIIGARSMAIISLLEEIRQYDLGPYWHTLSTRHCSHTMGKKDDVNDYVYMGYKKEMHQRLYSHVLPVVPSEKFGEKTNMGTIEPMLPRKMPGRPKRNRVRENCETSCGTKLSRRGRKMRCQKCFKLGHNSRKCPNTTNDAKASASSPVVLASSTPSIILGPTTHVATEAITQAHETTPQAQLHQDQGLFTEYIASSTPIVPSYSTP